MLMVDAMKEDTGEFPDDGVVGHERPEWYEVGTIRVNSGNLEIADLGVRSGVSFSVPTGLYRVEGRLIDFSGSLCPSRLRARLDGTNGLLSQEESTISIDIAHCWVADLRDVLRRLTDRQADELSRRAAYANHGCCEVCEMQLDSERVEYVVCQTGFGDGSYPVFSLNARRQIVGLEVEFVRDGYVMKRGR
jgi:hypothetical protein